MDRADLVGIAAVKERWRFVPTEKIPSLGSAESVFTPGWSADFEALNDVPAEMAVDLPPRVTVAGLASHDSTH
eukprot:12275877-Karenia_brevis.AAC.1